MPATVLLATDNPGRCDALRESLDTLGLSVTVAETGAEILQLHDRLSPRLILLATDIPDIHAFDVCRRLRRDSDVPVIVIGDNPSDFDSILALELGADDFIARDCMYEEVNERIRAALRRGAGMRLGEEAGDSLDFGEIVIDRRAHRMIVRGEVQELTPTELDLIWALAENAGEVISSDDLLASVWGYPEGIRTRTLDVHVSRLRRKLGERGRNARHIITVRGIGYRFEPHPTE